ncbi:hypothetical protein [Methanococcoides methylutens]|uniref:Uncharacterized protein n=1 Tax=Methanococcoides methylutens MM1 TaxID=1434104 RepID=A0A0E3STT3_METMT|nr:hypothetical protein [Methanococcoides methylutens]AKB86177.1 hypothetical protein MCMEM_2124 [Methanococcoides methylutens MM1]
MKPGLYRNVVLLLIVVFSLSAAGCEDIENGVEDIEGSVSQTMEDIDFLRWASDSAGVILDDYEAIKVASSERDEVLLRESGMKLKEDSEMYLEDLDGFTLSPSVEGVATEYRDFLQRSYEFGEFVETSSQEIDFEAIERTVELMNETSEMIGQISDMAGREV